VERASTTAERPRTLFVTVQADETPDSGSYVPALALVNPDTEEVFSYTEGTMTVGARRTNFENDAGGFVASIEWPVSSSNTIDLGNSWSGVERLEWRFGFTSMGVDSGTDPVPANVQFVYDSEI